MRAILVMTAVLGLGGCKGKGGGASDLVLTEANNYTYSGLLDIETIDITAGSDATVDWSGVTTDIRGRTLDPSTVQQIAILGVETPFDETIGLIERNELDQSQDAYLYDNAGGTEATLQEFNIIGAYLDVDLLLKENAAKTWIVSMLNVSNGQTDLLMSAVFAPSDSSDNVAIPLTSDSAKLTVDVDLHSAAAIPTTADSAPYTLDWTDVSNDVFGHPYQPILGDQLIVGRYDTEDIGEIEAGFLQLDTNAAELYQVNVYGVTAVDLDEAVDADDKPFPGFTTDGTWVVGVICTTCITPVPLLLSIVDVE